MVPVCVEVLGGFPDGVAEPREGGSGQVDQRYLLGECVLLGWLSEPTRLEQGIGVLIATAGTRSVVEEVLVDVVYHAVGVAHDP